MSAGAISAVSEGDEEAEVSDSVDAAAEGPKVVYPAMGPENVCEAVI